MSLPNMASSASYSYYTITRVRTGERDIIGLSKERRGRRRAYHHLNLLGDYWTTKPPILQKHKVVSYVE
jgi:hypothetical protein